MTHMADQHLPVFKKNVFFFSWNNHSLRAAVPRCDRSLEQGENDHTLLGCESSLEKMY